RRATADPGDRLGDQGPARRRRAAPRWASVDATATVGTESVAAPAIAGTTMRRKKDCGLMGDQCPRQRRGGAWRGPGRPVEICRQTVIPPSTTTWAPVMYDDSSEARNSATLAISSGVPIRRIGVWRTILSFSAKSPSIGVSITP